MELSVSFVWLIAGLIMVALEMLAISGVGFLFGGLGALSVGLLLEIGYLAPGNISAQIIAFFAFTAGWTALLWKPLQKMLKNKHAATHGYNDMVGQTATIAGKPLMKGQTGQASWSGTLMTAKLTDHASVLELPVGAVVVIRDVQGSTLMVEPKQ